MGHWTKRETTELLKHAPASPGSPEHPACVTLAWAAPSVGPAMDYIRKDLSKNQERTLTPAQQLSSDDNGNLLATHVNFMVTQGGRRKVQEMSHLWTVKVGVQYSAEILTALRTLSCTIYEPTHTNSKDKGPAS